MILINLQASAEKIRELFPSICGERSGNHSTLDYASIDRISKSSVDGYFDDIDQELRLRTEQLLKSSSGEVMVFQVKALKYLLFVSN